MNTPQEISNTPSPNASNSPILSPYPCVPQVHPTCMILLDLSILKSSASLHAGHQVSPRYLGLNSLLQYAKQSLSKENHPPKQTTNLSKFAPYEENQHVNEVSNVARKCAI
jgi:hypothetical protein